MSNPNSPFGFDSVGWNRGGPPNTSGVIQRPIQASYASNVCKGDAVYIAHGSGTTAGYVALGTTGMDGSYVAGIFIGCQYIDSAGNTRQSSYWPASNPNAGTAYILPIYGTSPQLFKVQATGTHVITFADVGRNIDLAVGTQTIVGGFGLSGMSVDTATLAATATLPFRVEGLFSDIAPTGYPGTDNASVNNIVLVSSNPFNALGRVDPS